MTVLPRSAVALMLLAACRGVAGGGAGLDPDPGSPDPPSGQGTIEVRTETPEPRPLLEYTVTISNGQRSAIGHNDSVDFTTRRLGLHDVLLAVPSPCAVQGEAHRIVDVPIHPPVRVFFRVRCGPALSAGALP